MTATDTDLRNISSVLATRLPMLALSMVYPTPARRKETDRMVQEKADAAIDGYWSLQKYWMMGMMAPWTLPMGAGLYEGAMDAFLAPGRKTLKANARRLKRRHP